jgi:RNA polymerase sigma-70 factor (ECF subfamily)
MPPTALTPVLVAQSDARLVALARQGHGRAFEVLIRRYRPQLLAHCRRIAPAHAAEDALQRALMGAWLALQNGAEVRTVRSWLHRVVHNAALRARASAGRAADVTDVQLSVEGPERQAERRHELREALGALALLPEQQREALLLTAVEGESYDDAAQWLGVSTGAVRGLVARTRATLRAAAAAVVPTPLLSWLLRRAKAGGFRAPAGAASAPAVGGMVVKGGAVLVAAGATAGAVAHLALPTRVAPPAVRIARTPTHLRRLTSAADAAASRWREWPSRA